MAGLPPLSLAIVTIVLLNAAFAFTQEYRAGKAAADLVILLPRKATVVRDGKRQIIEAEEVVPQDLVELSPGDVVPADIVLLDDNFASIVAAIKLGKGTYSNIRRFLTFHLTDNIAKLVPFVAWALSGGKIPLALSVLQLLALDIGTDALPALALGVEPPKATVMDEPPPRRHLIDKSILWRAFLYSAYPKPQQRWRPSLPCSLRVAGACSLQVLRQRF